MIVLTIRVVLLAIRVGMLAIGTLEVNKMVVEIR